METLAIHGINPIFFKCNFKDYILTFDDGLYSQYYYLPLIKEMKNQKIFFICSGLVGNDKKREQFNGVYKEFPDCYHSLATYRKSGDKSNYMNLDEVKNLVDSIGLENVGCHSHNHIKEYNQPLFEKIKIIKDDIELMLEWFEKNLNIKPIKYAFPHYVDDYFLKLILKDYGFKEFYGRERIAIEKEKDLLRFL
jgi:hypothetical protein